LGITMTPEGGGEGGSEDIRPHATGKF
jgi:hypothetical protein